MKKVYFYFILCCLVSIEANSQQRENRRLEKEASELLNIQDYISACPIVNYLDSIKYTSKDFAYYNGLCVFHTENKAASLPYFLESKKNGVKAHDLPFYLGRSFHFSLNFDSAIFYYRYYLSTLDTLHHHKHLIARSKEVVRFIENCENGKILIKDSLEVKIEHISSVVNGPYPDYSPVISSDESVLLFTSRRPNSTGGEIADDNKYYEDIYMSLKDTSGKWLPPIQLGDSVNSPGHDACIGMSADGQKLYIYRAWKHSDANGDLYVSNLDGHNWRKPQKLSGEINTSSWETSISISADENEIYFASDRKGGFGGNDLYVIKKKENGKFGHPQNLGPTINTPYDDDSPLIHTDGETLFFSSKGHDGMGGFDVFVSNYNPKDSTWTKPVNIGYPISTPGDDIYFSYTADGSKGYFSSFRTDSYGEKDLYIIHRPQDSASLVVFKGYIKDKETDKPIASTITLKNVETGKIENVFNSNALTGKYVVVLAFGKTYDVTIESEGYMYKSETLHIPEKKANVFQYVRNFFLDLIKKPADMLVVSKKDTLSTDSLSLAQNMHLKKEKKKKVLEFEDEKYHVHSMDYNRATYSKEVNTDPSKELSILSADTSFVIRNSVQYNKAYFAAESENVFTMNISMDKLDPGAHFVLRNIHFDFDKATLRSSSEQELERLYGLLIKNKSMRLEIAGHTDNKGTIEYNIELSMNRAKAVVEFLVSKGIDRNRLQPNGYGETEPITTNASAVGRQFNRRTEFEVMDTTFHYLSHPLRLKHTANDENIWRELPMKLHFPINESNRIYPFSEERLRDLIVFMKTHKQVNIALVGRADETLEKKSEQLVNQRSQAGRNLLLRGGIEGNRIKILPHSELPKYLFQQVVPGEISSRRLEFYIMN
ncbi:MAG: OmpA family protein [Opitutaceae bacterium]|nr:OmpA family protein [Cytophagales bacterium]